MVSDINRDDFLVTKYGKVFTDGTVEKPNGEIDTTGRVRVVEYDLEVKYKIREAAKRILDLNKE